MLKVLPIQSKEEQERICRLCGVEYKADLLAYGAESDGELAGVCQFKLTGEGGIIYDIASAKDFSGNVFEALFVMGRGTLNFIDLCDVHLAYYTGEVQDEGLIKAIGFRQNAQGKWEMDLTGFFTFHINQIADLQIKQIVEIGECPAFAWEANLCQRFSGHSC